MRLSLSELYVWTDEVKEASPHPSGSYVIAAVEERWRGRRREKNLIFRFQIKTETEEDLQGSCFLLPLVDSADPGPDVEQHY